MTRGEANIVWMEKHLRVPSGNDAGKPLKLRRWQGEIVIGIYDNAWGTSDAIISIARKNAKTTLAAGLLNLNLFCP